MVITSVMFITPSCKSNKVYKALELENLEIRTQNANLDASVLELKGTNEKLDKEIQTTKKALAEKELRIDVMETEIDAIGAATSTLKGSMITIDSIVSETLDEID